MSPKQLAECLTFSGCSINGSCCESDGGCESPGRAGRLLGSLGTVRLATRNGLKKESIVKV